MKKEVKKEPKIALCRACHGTGKVWKAVERRSRLLGGKRMDAEEETCPQCEGSGRVTVGCEMTLDIRPYKPREAKLEK